MTLDKLRGDVMSYREHLLIAGLIVTAFAGLTPASGAPADGDVWLVQPGYGNAYWRKIEASNGIVFALDMSHIFNAAGNARFGRVLQMCTINMDNGRCWGRLIQLAVDCKGFYTDFDDNRPQLVPPRSVIGQAAAIACAMKIPDGPPVGNSR
jgi:hypothetical protein